MSRLVALYPRSWRERYLAEMEELLAIHPPTPAEQLDLIAGAVDAWTHPQVRRPSGEVAHDVPERRAASILAVLGGVLFAVSGLVIASSHDITADGYRDNGPGVPLLVVGMLLTAIASLAAAGERRSRRIAAVMVGGGLAMTLTWPIVIIGFFSYAGAAIALGAALLSRERLIGLAPIAVGVILPSFNTQTDWALVGVPVGILWAVFAVGTWREAPPFGVASPPAPAGVAPG